VLNVSSSLQWCSGQLWVVLAVIICQVGVMYGDQPARLSSAAVKLA